MCSIDIVFCVHKRNWLLFFSTLIWHSTVCSFNEKANSKKLFAPIDFSVYFLNNFLYVGKGKLGKAFGRERRKKMKNPSCDLIPSDDLSMEIAQSAYANIWRFICMENFIMDLHGSPDVESAKRVISSFKICSNINHFRSLADLVKR